MSLGTPTAPGGDYLDFKDLVENAGKPVLIFAVVREFLGLEPKGTNKNTQFGPQVPVIADVFVADGPETGRLCPAVKVYGAPTSALRGVPKPKPEEAYKVHPPVNAVDTPYPFIVRIGTNAPSAYAQLDPAKGGQRKRAEEIYAKCGEEKVWTGDADLSWLTAEDTAPAEPAGEAAEPLGSGPFPWGEEPDSAA